MSSTQCPSCGIELERSWDACVVCGAPLAHSDSSPATIAGQEVASSALIAAVEKDGSIGETFQSSNTEGAQQLVGRTSADICFPEDEHMSPHHAALVWREDSLWLEDLQSENGVFVRIRSSVNLKPGDRFLAGEQLFEFEAAFVAEDAGDAQSTRFNGSPSGPWNFRIIQIMDHGIQGAAWPVFSNAFGVGRNTGDARFPDDRYMSRAHCRVLHNDAGCELQDQDSKNGTYHRIQGPHRIQNGDYLLVGSRLLRVTYSP